MVRNATFWDKFWRDEYGKDVIWQKPNIFLATWFVITFVTWFLPYSTFKHLILYIATGAIIIWSILEIYSGVNRFRKLLGILVLIAVIINHIR